LSLFNILLLNFLFALDFRDFGDLGLSLLAFLAILFSLFIYYFFFCVTNSHADSYTFVCLFNGKVKENGENSYFVIFCSCPDNWILSGRLTGDPD
jgi:hypothetical protein